MAAGKEFECEREFPDNVGNGVLHTGVPGGVPPWLSGYPEGDCGSEKLISLLCLEVRFLFFLTSPRNLLRSCSSQRRCLEMYISSVVSSVSSFSVWS